MPPPRTESLTNAGDAPAPPTRGGGSDAAEGNKWSQQPLPMIPIEEHDDDDEEVNSASETDVESCHSSNGDDGQVGDVLEPAVTAKAAEVASPANGDGCNSPAVDSGDHLSEEDLNATER